MNQEWCCASTVITQPRPRLYSSFNPRRAQGASLVFHKKMQWRTYFARHYVGKAHWTTRSSLEVARFRSFHHSHITHSASCVRRIAVVGERSFGDAVPVMYMSVEPPLEKNRFAAPVDHDSGVAVQGEVAPSAETVHQRRRLVLVFAPLAESEMFGGQESEADTESLAGAASEVEIVEILEPTVDSDPILTEPLVCAQHQEHSPVWTQLISTKFSNCGQE